MPNHVDLDGNYLSPRQLAARGAAALVVVLLVAAGLYVKSSRLLNHGVHIVAELRNVGDGLPVRSDVKYRGILVGFVDNVVPATGDQPNHVHVHLKREYAGSIPATVTARVVPSNVFAMSSVQLVEQGPGAPIRDGARIREDTQLSTVLFQTMLSKLRNILAAVGRGRDDHTVGVLAAMAAATNNRRSQLLTSASQLNHLLDELNGIVASDQNPSTVSALVDAAHGLAQTAPELVDALHEAVAPMRTFVEKQQELRTFIAAGEHTTGTTVVALQNHTDQLVQISADLTPVIGVLADNARHFVPIARRITKFSDVFFEQAWDPELSIVRGRVNVSFTPSYSYTRADCPRYGELRGPSCFTAPLVAVRPDLPSVLLPQNYQPPNDLAPPSGTFVGADGNLVAVGPPLVNPNPTAPNPIGTDPNPPLPPGVTPAPPVPGTANPDVVPVAPSSFGGNVGPVGSEQERRALGVITGQPATTATQLILGPIARGATVTRILRTSARGNR
jgi:phospholipid/cholesterol/gamma-HCH transport system substrate-binding protein